MDKDWVHWKWKHCPKCRCCQPPQDSTSVGGSFCLQPKRNFSNIYSLFIRSDISSYPKYFILKIRCMNVLIFPPLNFFVCPLPLTERQKIKTRENSHSNLILCVNHDTSTFNLKQADRWILKYAISKMLPFCKTKIFQCCCQWLL